VTTGRFDELIHAPTRLAIVSLLAAVEWAAFKFVRDEVGLSDSALSKQLTTLENAGYLEIRKAFVGKRPRTSARLTRGPARVRAARGGAAGDRGAVRRRARAQVAG
jgi:DNA-binding transcriptional ArsR family regulator